MTNLAWPNSITLRHPFTDEVRKVECVRDACAALHHFWPAYHGSQYRLAEKACEQAKRGEMDMLKVRRAFISAAVEAHFYLS